MLYEILARAAASSPEKTAVVCGSDEFSYAELKDRVDRLAAGLRSLGAERDSKIVILSRNCHRFLESYFAAAGIGAVLVPINTRLTPHEIRFILEDSQAELLIAEPELFACLEKDGLGIPAVRTVLLTGQDDTSAGPQNPVMYESLLGLKPEIGERKPAAPEDIAQIYYTSGTTGKPKGVILTHENNVEHAKGAIEELKLSCRDVWLHVSPMFHLADAWAVWAMTGIAAAHVMAPRFEPDEVLNVLERLNITLSNFIPTMLNVLVNRPGVKNRDFSSFRLVLSGGAPIAREVIRKVLDVFDCVYVQTYGLTETSPFLTMSFLKEKMKDLPFEKKLDVMATTGRPFTGVDLKVVREDGGEVRRDGREVGEIIARGRTVTPGYWGLPETTAERIVDGWLHTRDLAVIDPQGYISIVDRKDDVIITGGENVYSVEVEDVLYRHPGILEAAVIGLPDQVWGERVCAVVVPKGKTVLSEAGLIEFCRAHLAGFKVPKSIFFTDELPKTGSHKIYKYRLRELYGKDRE